MKKVFLSLMLMFSISFAYANYENGNNFNDQSNKQIDTKVTKAQDEYIWCLNLTCRTICLTLTEEQLPSSWGEVLGVYAEWEEFVCGEDDGWGDW